METCDLQLRLSELRIFAEGRLSSHEDVEFTFSFDTNTLFFKQIPVLDASGICICYTINLSDIRYLGREIGQEGHSTIDLELLRPVNSHLVIPKSEEATPLQDHNVTISMCCSLSKGELPLNTKLSLNIAQNESDTTTILIDIFRDASYLRTSSPALDDFNQALQTSVLELAAEDLDFLEQRGIPQNVLSAATDQGMQANGEVWFDYHNVATTTQLIAKHSAKSQPSGAYNVGQGRSQGGQRGQGRVRGSGRKNGHEQTLPRQSFPMAKNSIESPIPKTKPALNTQEQAEYNAQEAPRLRRAEEIRKFFTNDDINKPEIKKGAYEAQETFAAAVAESKSDWQTFATDRGRAVASNNRNPLGRGQTHLRGSCQNRPSRVVETMTREEAKGTKEERMRPGDWNDLSYEQMKEMLGE